jgi:hypothetical protein
MLLGLAAHTNGSQAHARSGKKLLATSHLLRVSNARRHCAKRVFEKKTIPGYFPDFGVNL